VWDRWDAPHVREIAQLGYGPPADPARIVLLPLFPALMAAGALVVSPLLAGSLISFGATLVATAGLYVLARRDGGDCAMGRTAVLALVLFPTAFALVAPYSEALFLATPRPGRSSARAGVTGWSGSTPTGRRCAGPRSAGDRRGRPRDVSRDQLADIRESAAVPDDTGGGVPGPTTVPGRRSATWSRV